MRPLLKLSRAIDAINTRIGRTAAWAILAAVIISTVAAIARKTAGVSSNAWLEVQPLLFGAVFLLCAPWALAANAHIRIDVVAQRLSLRTRNWIELIGHGLFLIPMTLAVIATSWPYFVRSWLQGEQSANPGGLPQYLGKGLVPLAFGLLLAQGVSELIKRIAIMRGSVKGVAK